MKVIEKKILLEKIKDTPEKGELITFDVEPKRLGKVITIGKDVQEVKIGDIVKYPKFFDGEEFRENDKFYLVMNYTQILIVY